MKQIYKYLPYNPLMLWGSHNSLYYKKGETYSLQDLMFCPKGTSNYDYYEFVDWLHWNNVKPLLRPFEDLTKELPLTKAAAELAGMKEGEIVKVIDNFYYVLGLDIVSDAVYPYTFPVWNMDYDSENTKIRLNKNFTVWIDSVNPHFEELLDFEKAFDFLRAMHFAVDFEEGSYIKLED